MAQKEAPQITRRFFEERTNCRLHPQGTTLDLLCVHISTYKNVINVSILGAAVQAVAKLLRQCRAPVLRQ